MTVSYLYFLVPFFTQGSVMGRETWHALQCQKTV